ncbi:hypothetical protein RRG08_049120 [Elysia crispata]|uniref:Uncharacterized protein n=1 Tax=Elysia crispata TaxID=231223 RepID=A0AAE0YV53_9GAST|nr:hypothetical protein RRG08_049120 [Elysia crispata]
MGPRRHQHNSYRKEASYWFELRALQQKTYVLTGGATSAQLVNAHLYQSFINRKKIHSLCRIDKLRSHETFFYVSASKDYKHTSTGTAGPSKALALEQAN